MSWLFDINFVFLSCCIIIIPNIIQNGKVVPEIFKFENDPITYQVTSAIFGRFFGQIRIFPKNSIRPHFTPYSPLTSCKRSEKTNEAILRKIPKTSFLGHFWPFLAIFGQIRISPKNRAPSVFCTYGPLTSCKKSEKTNEPILRKVRHGQTDRRTDWQKQFYRTLELFKFGSNLKMMNLMLPMLCLRKNYNVDNFKLFF